MKKTDILVIFTGGTIATAPPVNGVKAQEVFHKPVTERSADDYFLLRKYKDTQANYLREHGITFHTRQPLETDSSNMTLTHWNALLADFKAIDFSQYAGVIITHGTDTIGYTAPLVAILLSHLTIPVVMVSSNEHLRSPLANGHKNFADSVAFIVTQSSNDPDLRKICGTYVAYSYDLRTTTFYIATEVKQSQAFVNRYESRTGTDFGYMENNQFYVTNIDRANRQHKDSFIYIAQFFEKWKNTGKTVLDMVEYLENKVLLLQPYIGLNYSDVHVPAGIEAVLSSTYHSYTFSLSHEPAYNVHALDDKGADIYFANYLYNEYAQADNLAGFNFLVGTTTEYAYAKLVIAYNIFGKSDPDTHKAQRDDFLKLAFNRTEFN